MPQRALWNGFLKLSLVSCPIALFAATAADKRLSFRQVNRTTGNALRQQLVDAVTGESISNSDAARGYEIGTDRFVIVDDGEIADAMAAARERPFTASSIQDEPVEVIRHQGSRGHARDALSVPHLLQSKADLGDVRAAVQPVAHVPRPINTRTIDLDRFVSSDEIDIRFVDSPYYIVPRDETADEAFAVIREAMRERAMAGMGRVILQKRERPIVVIPRGQGMVGLTLRYSHEIREDAGFFNAIPKIDLPDDMVEMATLLIDRKAGNFDAALLEDRYRTVMVERLRAKSVDPTPARRSAEVHDQNVVDLMAALKRSVGREPLGKRSAANPVSSRPAAARAKKLPVKRSRGR